MDRVSRRRFLVMTGGAAVLGGGVGLSACGGGQGSSPIEASDGEVGRRERSRGSASARVVTAALTAAPTQLDLAGRIVPTWGYSQPLVRATAGDILEVELTNQLPEATTVHWHGLALRNDMDGVQDTTQRPVGSGERFTYRFTLPDPGTFFFHPHTGLQLDRALHAPLIIDDPGEPGAYDAEHVLVLDDWLDGLDGTPDAAFEQLTAASTSSSTDGMDHDIHG